MCNGLTGGTTTTMTATAIAATTTEIATTEIDIMEIRTPPVTDIAATVLALTLDDSRPRRGEIAALATRRPRGMYPSKPDGRELTVIDR